MHKEKRPPAFWAVVVFLVVSLLLLLAGQTTAVFDYGFAVQLGLQEREDLVSSYGVEVNRAFGVADTLIYVPLISLSLVGLFLRKEWSLLTAAAVMGISAYWATTVDFMLLFLRGVPGYQLTPGLSYWLLTGAYIIIGIWGIAYLALHGKRLIE